MPQLHDPACRESIRARIGALTPDTPHRWGRMSSGQMLWHCNQILRTSLGETKVVHRSPPFPSFLLKFILFNTTWPHNMPTAPEYEAQEPREFEVERGKCYELIDRFVARALGDAGWAPAVFGPLTGREWSRLQAKHLDHHLRQFGA